MKQHKGMRPHDVVVLLKIAAKAEENWLMKDLSYELGISASEVSESINRSVLAGLIAADKQTLMRRSLMEFLEFGLKFTYPQHPGSIVRGMYTGHSAPPMNALINGEEQYVWPYAMGQDRGQRIEPLHPNVPKACGQDFKLYELLALVDAIRIGKVRERELAIIELEKRILC